MIENENQYQITKKWVNTFCEAIKELENDEYIHPGIRGVRLDQYRDIVAIMLYEIYEYEQCSAKE